MLKREQRLEQIVRLIGPDALPDSERLILRVAEMIKNGFLQQNGFDKVDCYCTASKQVKILELMMEFYARALSVVKNGCPLTKVNALDVCEEIVRIKTGIPNDEIDKIHDVELHLERQFGELESIYSKAAI